MCKSIPFFFFLDSRKGMEGYELTDDVIRLDSALAARLIDNRAEFWLQYSQNEI